MQYSSSFPLEYLYFYFMFYGPYTIQINHLMISLQLSERYEAALKCAGFDVFLSKMYLS